MGSTIYSEVFVWCRVLIGEVLGNDFVRDVAGTATEVASCPQMPAPELLLQMRELRQQVMRGSAFQPLHQPADRRLRRNRHEQMHMVLRDVPFQDRDIMLPADITDQIPHPPSHLALQRRPSVLRNPHQVQMDVEYSVRAPPVFRHPRSLSGAHALKAVA